MPADEETGRCWICDAALWVLPIWTWAVVCLTSVFMLAFLRPDAIGGCLMLMGSLLVVIGVCVGTLIEERTRDRSLAQLTAKNGRPPSKKP